MDWMRLCASFFSAFLPFSEVKHIQDDQHYGRDQKKDLEKLYHEAFFMPVKLIV
jgi:hypothetical protein